MHHDWRLDLRQRLVRKTSCARRRYLPILRESAAFVMKSPSRTYQTPVMQDSDLDPAGQH
jgi:hypothetical protein